MTLVRSFDSCRVVRGKCCGKCIALVVAVLFWQQKAFGENYLAPWANRANLRQVSRLRAQSIPGFDHWWCDSSGTEKCLKEVFESKMQTEVARPLVNFSEYCESLPKRESGAGTMSLYKMPYIVQERELERMATELARERQARRGAIMYLAAPSMRGKSASVLPAFLYGALHGMNLTHYLYMPFHHNGKRYHHPARFKDQSEQALKQIGAEYMLACFYMQVLYNRYLKNWIAPASLTDGEQTERDFRDAVDLFMDHCPDGVLLIHLDEHRYMSDNSAVRRGAMELLTSLQGRVKVIATYTDLPVLAPAGISSEVCRVPIPMPMLDVNWLLNHWKEFDLSEITANVSADSKRLYASLKLLVGLAVTELGLICLHIGCPEMQDFARELQAAKRKAGPQRNANSLLVCCDVAYRTWASNRKMGETADLVSLLVGFNEHDKEVTSERFGSVVVLGDAQDAFLSAPLAALLRDEPARGDSTPPGIRDLFRSCQSTFRRGIEARRDLLSGKVLELAFLWALACRAALTNGLTFDELSISEPLDFRCEQIEASRIFGKTSTMLNQTSIQELRHGVLYYADESNDSHPSSDIWFKSGKGELVLVEVGGGSRLGSPEKGGAAQKVYRMHELLVRNGPRTDLVGVVLLPNIPSKLQIQLREKAIGKEVPGVRLAIVTGAEAQRLLGGLAQLLTWLGDNED